MTEPKNSDALVSIILPTFNCFNYLNATISSVLNQTYTAFELIIIDDCSNDNSVDLILQMQAEDSRIKLLQLSVNSGGPAKPRNFGLTNARGDYVAFIDADDIWHPHKLSIQLKMMEQFKLDICSTRVNKFSNDLQVNFGDFSGSQGYEKVSISRLLKKNILAASSVVITKEKAGSLKFSELQEHQAIEDYIAWLEIHKRQDIQSARLQDKLVFYREREDSISSSKLKMACRIFSLLCEFEMGGNKLGWKKYYYFLTYLFGALNSKMYS